MVSQAGFMPGKRGQKISKHKENLTDFGELFQQLCEYLGVNDSDISRMSGLLPSSISRVTRMTKKEKPRDPTRGIVVRMWAALEQVAREKDLPMTQELKDIFFNIAPAMHATPEQAASAKRRMGMVYSMLEEARKHDSAFVTEIKALRIQVSEQAQTIEKQVQRIEDLSRMKANLNQTIEGQDSELSWLRGQLDIEKRYLSDTTPHTFKSWLRKQPASPLKGKLLTDELTPARGTRAHYEAHVRRLHCSEEERDDFARLWKLMLLQS